MFTSNLEGFCAMLARFGETLGLQTLPKCCQKSSKMPQKWILVTRGLERGYPQHLRPSDLQPRRERCVPELQWHALHLAERRPAAGRNQHEVVTVARPADLRNAFFSVQKRLFCFPLFAAQLRRSCLCSWLRSWLPSPASLSDAPTCALQRWIPFRWRAFRRR